VATDRRGYLQKDTGESLLTIIVTVHNISGRTRNLAAWIPEAVLENVEVILIHDESKDSTKHDLEHLLLEMYNIDYPKAPTANMEFHRLLDHTG
jgi:hypothetical protein